ncbi:MAG TPA: STAS domain-containing protein [Acidobacteriaceae bacterium]|jgi:anti-anti-sigma factor|nr:STAS domain-containing protein [Acidobacteriaceae bacterium]
MADGWLLRFTIEAGETPETPVTFLCSGYVAPGEALTRFREQADRFAEAGRDIVLDFAHVTGMHREGIGVLINLKEKVKKQGHSCGLRHPSKRVTELLKVTGLAPYFEEQPGG